MAGKDVSITTTQVRGVPAWAYNGGLNGYKTLVVEVPAVKTGFIIFANNGDGNTNNPYNPLAELFIDQGKPAGSSQPESGRVRKPANNDTVFNKKLAGDYMVFGHMTVLYNSEHRVKGFEVNNGTISHLVFMRIQ